jgi:hypothetical protein
MSTTAPAPERQALTREQKLGLYVALEALDLVLIQLLDCGPLTVIPEYDTHDIDTAALAVHLNETSALDLVRELWPEDPDAGDIPREERPEWRLAEAMSELLQARIFCALRDLDDEWFADVTKRELEQASREVASVARGVPLGGDLERYYSDPEYRAAMPCGECGVAGGCEHFPAR